MITSVEPSSSKTVHSGILLPIHSQLGIPQGVVVLTRSMPADSTLAEYFTYDDVAIVEAMLQAFAPALATIQANDVQRFSMQKLTHELRVPIQTFGAILEGMKSECDEKEFRFHYPHFNEAEVYCDLMRRLMREMDLVRMGPSEIPLACKPTRLWTDIIMPLRRFLTPLLRKYEFRRSQIIESGFDTAPIVNVDPGLITQILFNLVDNALKYYDGPPTEFYCKLLGQHCVGGFQIRVINNSPGIAENDTLRLFEYGWRGETPRPERPGEGIGLWIARGVAERHGGSLRLASARKPTEFVLTIPGNRVSSAPLRGSKQ